MPQASRVLLGYDPCYNGVMSPTYAQESLRMTVTRRQFLSWLGAGASISLLGALPTLAQTPTPTPTSALPVPPSLMLHSRHRWLLPKILDWMVGEGYQGVTYLDYERALLGQQLLPSKPVIISIDDLVMDRGNPSFAYFVAMKDSLMQAQFRGVFAIITRPHLEQLPERWAQVAEWVNDGVEFATHTSYHSVLDSLTQAQMDAEIVDSVAMIESYIPQDVRTLITPYGSGYTRDKGVLPHVLASAQTANLRFIVGILDGRQAIPRPIAEDAVFYVGRTKPGLSDTLEGTIHEMTHWKST